MKTVKSRPVPPGCPTGLTKRDPYQQLEEVFDYAHLPDLEVQLWEWLKTTVSGNFHKDLSRSERSSLLMLYEKMQQLLEASHDLHLLAQKKKLSKRFPH